MIEPALLPLSRWAQGLSTGVENRRSSAVKSPSKWKASTLRMRRPGKNAQKKLAACTPASSTAGREAGLTARFILPTMASGGKPFDMNTLCEPPFSVAVNRTGRFGGACRNTKWWSASKKVGATHGCHLTISEAPATPSCDRPPVPSGVYVGPMPRHARKQTTAEWGRELIPRGTWVPDDIALSCFLAFSSASINIGDIATGDIKSLIDCLRCLWGEVLGSPADHRIDMLKVTKAIADVPCGGICLALWDLARRVGPGRSPSFHAFRTPPRKEGRGDAIAPAGSGQQSQSTGHPQAHRLRGRLGCVVRRARVSRTRRLQVREFSTTFRVHPGPSLREQVRHRAWWTQ